MTSVIIVVGLLGAVFCSPLPSRDILAGQEFLAVFMRSHQPRSSGSYFINNNLIHNEVKPTDPTSTTPEATETTTDLTTWATEPAEEPPSQVVKVSVTSSVVRQQAKPHEEVPIIAATADEPTITAVQRSHFGVDETAGAITIKQAPASSFTVERSQDGENTSFTVKQTHQGESRSSFTIQRNIPVNLEKVEERTSFSVVTKQEEPKPEPVKEEETIIEQRTFSTEARTARGGEHGKVLALAKNWPLNDRVLVEQKIEDRREQSTYPSKEVRGHSPTPSIVDFNSQQTAKNWVPNEEVNYQETKSYPSDRTSRKFVPEHNKNWAYPERIYGEPEKNYEVDEAVSVISNGRVHGVQGSTQNPNKLGYVVEGSNFRKYRVEEKTPDGFIVGEYGVVSHDDGSLRGVRYTADSNINPRLIYDALVKFLSLK